MTRQSILFVPMILVAASGCAPWKSVTRVPLGPADAPAAAYGPACRLASASTLAVVLQNLDVDAVLAADPDVLVIDWATGRNACGELDRAQVDALRQRPGDPRGDRIVLARLDIGTPDARRIVFHADAADGSCVPAVMVPMAGVPGNDGPPAPDDPAWQSALCEGPGSIVARIAGLGFDGLWVDGMAGGIAKLLPDQAAAVRMGGLFRAVAESARALNPGMIVVAADPVGIAGPSGIPDAITAVAFQGSMFRDGYVLPASELGPVLARFNGLRAAGVPVLAVEFIDDAVQESHFAAICRRFGYLCYSGLPGFNHLEPLTPAGNRAACRP